MVPKHKLGHESKPNKSSWNCKRSTCPSQFLRRHRQVVQFSKRNTLAARWKLDTVSQRWKIPEVPENGSCRDCTRHSELERKSPPKRREHRLFHRHREQICKVAPPKRVHLIWDRLYSSLIVRESRCSRPKLIHQCLTWPKIFLWCRLLFQRVLWDRARSASLPWMPSQSPTRRKPKRRRRQKQPQLEHQYMEAESQINMNYAMTLRSNLWESSAQRDSSIISQILR